MAYGLTYLSEKTRRSQPIADIREKEAPFLSSDTECSSDRKSNPGFPHNRLAPYQLD